MEFRSIHSRRESCQAYRRHFYVQCPYRDANGFGRLSQFKETDCTVFGSLSRTSLHRPIAQANKNMAHVRIAGFGALAIVKHTYSPTAAAAASSRLTSPFTLPSVGLSVSQWEALFTFRSEYFRWLLFLVCPRNPGYEMCGQKRMSAPLKYRKTGTHLDLDSLRNSRFGRGCRDSA